MITKALLKSGPVACVVAPVARARRGRPALIPPDAWADKSAAGWLQFSFYFDTDQARRRVGQPVGQWLLAMPGQRPANWCQVHALFCTLPQAAALADRCRRIEARALAAEREAARLADLLANQA